MGILSREGADFGGYWRIILNSVRECIKKAETEGPPLYILF